MAIDFKKTIIAGHFPEIWRGECKILPGGFKPVQDFPVGTTIHRGTPVFVNFEDLSAAICKTAKVLAGGTTSAPRISKGHYFVQGDRLTKYGDGKASPTISKIDTSNADYDVLTLSAAYTGLKEDDILVESSAFAAAAGESPAVNAEPLYTPNMVTGAVKVFDGKGLPTLDVAYDAIVLYPSLKFPLLEEWLIDPKSPCLKFNPSIKFIKQ